MNKSTLLLFSLFIVILNSCKKNNDSLLPATDFGTAEFYEPFLFYNSDTVILSKSLKFNFNDYAEEKRSSVKIQFVDTAQNVITDQNVRFYINDELVNDNEFDLKSQDSTNGIIKIGLQLLPGHPNGYTSGFLSISNHSLDVINNNDLNSSDENRIFKWEAKYQVIMNPLKKILIWIGILILSLLVIWFMVLRNLLHSKFEKGRISIVSPVFDSIELNKNTKLVVFTNTPNKQNLFNSIFTGKIIYKINPIYEGDIILRPGRKNQIKIKLPLGAVIKPSVINLDKFKQYTIQLNNQEIKIQYS